MGFIRVKDNVNIVGVRFNPEQVELLIEDYIVDEFGNAVDPKSSIGALIKPRRFEVIFSELDTNKKYSRTYTQQAGVYAGWVTSFDGNTFKIEIDFDSEEINLLDEVSKKVFAKG